MFTENRRVSLYHRSFLKKLDQIRCPVVRKGGSDPQSTTSFPEDPVNPGACCKTLIVAKRVVKIGRRRDLQISGFHEFPGFSDFLIS